MAQRMYRELSKETKNKISQSLQQYHQRKSTGDAMECRAKQSTSMRKYWQGIPSIKDADRRNADGDISMDAYLAGK